MVTTCLQNHGQKGLIQQNPTEIFMVHIVDMQGYPIKQISFQSDGGAQRSTVADYTNFRVLTDQSATYTSAPSSSHNNFQWSSTGHCCRIISCINKPGLLRAQASTASNVSVTIAKSSIFERPLQVAPTTAHLNFAIFQNSSYHRLTSVKMKLGY